MSPSNPMIKSITARAVDAPLARPITTAMVSIPSAPLILFDVETNGGVTGRAYILGYSPITLRPIIELTKNLSEMLVGKPLRPVDRYRDAENAFRLLGRQGLLGMALSGLDMAYWDALGQSSDLAVAQLLGSDLRPIPAYDSFGIIEPDRDMPMLEQSVKDGFTAIKIKVGDGDLSRDRRTIGIVRKAFGPDLKLMIDFNQSLSVPEAIWRINHLAEFDLHWVEEPVPAENLSGHAKVRQKTGVPIQTGENWWFPEDTVRAIDADACDHAMLDIMNIGGVTGWMRAAAQAEAASLPVSSHTFVEASAHVLAASPTVHYLEYLEIANAVLSDPIVAVNGAVTPRGPGLGIVWDEDAVARYMI